jgi:CheY-like chemotaxis protein
MGQGTIVVRCNLLIVEDDDDISETLYDVFEDRGYLVWRAGNGREALDIVAREAFRPDVILLDLRMPVMDGVEFLQIRQEVPLLAASRVIVMTAQPALFDDIEAPVFAQLTKPVGLDEVLDTVERAFDTPTEAGQPGRAA